MKCQYCSLLKKLVNIYNIKLFVKKNNVLVVDLVMVIEARPLRMITEIHFFKKFYFIFKLYIIVLVLPSIKINPPQVYMCSPS